MRRQLASSRTRVKREARILWPLLRGHSACGIVRVDGRQALTGPEPSAHDRGDDGVGKQKTIRDQCGVAGFPGLGWVRALAGSFEALI